tara:strand:+ start:633 stop:1376 length:744 start_codon:yes stop_codon:yes gene_type:complete
VKFFFDWQRTFVTIILFPIFCGLGIWQLDRAEEKRLLKNLLEERQGLSARIFSWKFMNDPEQSLQYLPIQVTGTFLPDSRIFLTHRIRLGKVGSDVVEPMILSDGSGAVLVNRGWIPQTIGERGSSLKTDQLGESTVTGKIHVPQGKAPLLLSEKLKGPWPLKVRTVNVKNLVEMVSDRLDIQVFPHIVRIDPNQAGSLEANWPELQVRSGGHIGYALQWFAMAFVTLAVFVYRSTNLNQFFNRIDT